MKRGIVVTTMVAALFLVGGVAQAGSIDPFVGNYVGTALVETDGTINKRDLNITIKKVDNAFEVDWTTVIPKDKKSVRRQFKIRFLPTERKDVFKAAMRTNVFGAAVPLDPLKGDPYIWAAIRDKSLVVYGLIVTDEGGYELQVYERTLKPGGMTVRFTRIHDGKQLKEITGEVKRAK